MDVRMDGRVAVITGASTGLGLAMAKEFAASGASVALLARKAEALKAAGLNRVTVSLDSLDDAVFKAMNDVDYPVAKVLEGIAAALADVGVPDQPRPSHARRLLRLLEAVGSEIRNGTEALPDSIVAQHAQAVLAGVDATATLANEAMAGIDVAVFLVHSIGEGADWVERERAIARNFRLAAEQAGVKRIVYLGGLGDDSGTSLSPHLSSRHDVGDVLRSGPVPVTELRAAVIIGSGSASLSSA